MVIVWTTVQLLFLNILIWKVAHDILICMLLSLYVHRKVSGLILKQLMATLGREHVYFWDDVYHF